MPRARIRHSPRHLVFFPSKDKLIRVRRALRIDRFLLVSLSAISVLVFLSLISIRFTSVAEFDWLEGSISLAAERVSRGLALYTKPSIEYTPWFYGPAYFYLVAAPLSFVKNPDLLLQTARLVSVLSTLITIVLIGFTLMKWTRNRVWALFGMGLFSSMAPLANFVSDMARVDAFFVVLLAALPLFSFSPLKLNRIFLLGALIALITLTKQTGILILSGIVLSLVIQSQIKQALLVLLSFCFFFLPPVIYLHINSHGWFSYLYFHLPRLHEMKLSLQSLYDISFNLGWTFLPTGVFCALYFIRKDLGSYSALSASSLVISIGTVGLISITPLLKVHGDKNNLLPLILFMSLFVPYSAHVLCNLTHPYAIRVLALLSLIFPHIIGMKNSYLPNKERERKTLQSIEFYRGIEGPILDLGRSRLVRMAGKDSHSQWSPMRDIFIAKSKDRQPEALHLHQKFKRRIEKQFYEWIVLPPSLLKNSHFPQELLERNYTLRFPLGTEKNPAYYQRKRFNLPSAKD